MILCRGGSPSLIMKHQRNSQSNRVRWFIRMMQGPFNGFRSPQTFTFTLKITSKEDHDKDPDEMMHIQS